MCAGIGGLFLLGNGGWFLNPDPLSVSYLPKLADRTNATLAFRQTNSRAERHEVRRVVFRPVSVPFNHRAYFTKLGLAASPQ